MTSPNTVSEYYGDSTSTLVFTTVFEFTVTFSLFYLFNWIFPGLMHFSFLQGKLCAPKRPGMTQRFCAPDHVRSVSGEQIVQAFNTLLNSGMNSSWFRMNFPFWLSLRIPKTKKKKKSDSNSILTFFEAQ